MILPLPAVAFDVSKVLAPVQNEVLPVIAAVGTAFFVTTNANDVYEQELLFVIITVYDPAELAA